MVDRPVVIRDRGGWLEASGPPHRALRPLLRAYQGYFEPVAVPARMRTLPTRGAVVIVNLGPPMRLATPSDAATEYGSFVAGMHDGHGEYTTPGGQHGIQLDVTPLGAYTLLGVPMAQITNAAAELPDVLGAGAAELAERLAETPSWAARFDLMDAFLLRRLEIGPVPDPEVARAWRLLDGTGGAVGVARLAEEVGWSRRHLTQRFTEQAGLPPKVMGRVLRFRRAIGLLSDGGLGPAEAAAACGYYDQAHLNREFRALAGCTPSQLLGGMLEEQRTTTAAEPA
ncbi:helix-turn-helix domain-containing protein [Actinomadura nitritigenes]|uniref:helix-turn-helix domain-containing protein n=1 Tax=Actinomadura nitritigenes TaxID=134602 RepID=UPI003D8F1FFC